MKASVLDMIGCFYLQSTSASSTRMKFGSTTVATSSLQRYSSGACTRALLYHNVGRKNHHASGPRSS